MQIQKYKERETWLMSQYLDSQRAWIRLGGMKIEEGFFILFMHINELPLYLPHYTSIIFRPDETTISRVATFGQVQNFVKNEHCRNVDVATDLIRMYKKWFREHTQSKHPRLDLTHWRPIPNWFTTNKWVLDNQYHIFVQDLLYTMQLIKSEPKAYDNAKMYAQVAGLSNDFSGSDKFHADRLLMKFKKEINLTPDYRYVKKVYK